ncbi:hypothetical protein L873DRAFT_1800418 [Choiromyces venosus 120613-1]|uniref:Uncharacterized protein n=1 Tax=Choiromyces venosus 120613-1 TaxID=1336337 RepID=A0A3N4KD73_9PEZI|nr:hypothetical protein L873DRAFT_1800418 [Choiromyces venosus 120613-1]
MLTPKLSIEKTHHHHNLPPNPSLQTRNPHPPPNVPTHIQTGTRIDHRNKSPIWMSKGQDTH